MIQRLLDWFRGYRFGRSSKWPRLRREYLQQNPKCEFCGKDKDLEVHHIRPVSKYPKDELKWQNLMTLCGQSGNKCHWMWGHGMNYHKFNPQIREDAEHYKSRL